MSERVPVDDPTDEQLLDALYDTDWLDASTIARTRFQVGRDGASTQLVARRLSRLADQGRCEKKHENGSGFYRRLP